LSNTQFFPGWQDWVEMRQNWGSRSIIADTRSAGSDMTNHSPEFYFQLLHAPVNYCHSPRAPCITGVGD
jgi:hypothetical protein